MRFAVLALALLASPVLAQDAPLRPGDIDASSIEPYVFEFDVYIVAPMQQFFGTATETFSIDDDQALSVVFVSGQGVQQTDSVTVEWPSFAPIRTVSVVNGMVQDLEFSPNAVSGMLRSGTAVDATLDAPVFGPGTADVISRLIMLKEGATTQFVSFDDDSPDTPALTTLATTGQEEVLGRTAWIVTAETGGETTTYALDSETGETLRVSFSPQPGVQIELRRSDLDATE